MAARVSKEWTDAVEAHLNSKRYNATQKKKVTAAADEILSAVSASAPLEVETHVQRTTEGQEITHDSDTMDALQAECKSLNNMLTGFRRDIPSLAAQAERDVNSARQFAGGSNTTVAEGELQSEHVSEFNSAVESALKSTIGTIEDIQSVLKSQKDTESRGQGIVDAILARASAKPSDIDQALEDETTSCGPDRTTGKALLANRARQEPYSHP